MLKVHFVNGGLATDEGYKTVELLKLSVCAHTQQPLAVIANPYWRGDTLMARFEGTEWICDLD